MSGKEVEGPMIYRPKEPERECVFCRKVYPVTSYLAHLDGHEWELEQQKVMQLKTLNRLVEAAGEKKSDGSSGDGGG